MQAFLILETGEAFSGRWHGGSDRAGEVVFNTSFSGYQEIATDPSYMNQIVVMTSPMMGNYGVHNEDTESSRYWIEGFISLQIQESSRDQQWLSLLESQGIPVVSEIDTRTLTLRLRSGGTPWGALVQANSEAEAREKAITMIEKKKQLSADWVWLASTKEPYRLQGEHVAGPRIAVLDFGTKTNILRELKKYSRELVVLPSRSSVEQVLSTQPDALMLTNGPGDPASVEVAVETVKALLGRLPIFGICMGHQILGLALGAKTYKLTFGHRGSNHPIKDDLLKKVYVTSQNHGYAVDEKTLPSEVVVTHRNLNDQTVAGIYSEKWNCLGIQYHPESCPGPHEARELFRFFAEKMI